MLPPRASSASSYSSSSSSSMASQANHASEDECGHQDAIVTIIRHDQNDEEALNCDGQRANDGSDSSSSSTSSGTLCPRLVSCWRGFTLSRVQIAVIFVVGVVIGHIVIAAASAEDREVCT